MRWNDGGRICRHHFQFTNDLKFSECIWGLEYCGAHCGDHCSGNFHIDFLYHHHCCPFPCPSTTCPLIPVGPTSWIPPQQGERDSCIIGPKSEFLTYMFLSQLYPPIAYH